MIPGNYFREYDKKKQQKMHIEEKCLKGTKLILTWVRDSETFWITKLKVQ